MINRISFFVLLFCFTAGTSGASFNACPGQMSPSQQATPGMDCHASTHATKSQQPTKDHCCVELSCPKCFPSPLVSAHQSLIVPKQAPIAYLWPARHIPSQNGSIAQERPPKIG